MITDVPIDEFLGEAEDVIDSLNGDLLAIHDAVSKSDKVDPSLVNNLFRAAHSLKGISGLFGFTELTSLAHTLESMLDRLRMGKINMGEWVLDLLFESVDMLRAVVAGKAEDVESPALKDIEDLIARLELKEPEKKEEKDGGALSCVGSEIMAVLTEYEEHRLLENIQDEMHIIKVRASFSLATFDEDLTELQAICKKYGEIITTLPSAEESGEDKITFDLIIGTDQSLEIVQEALAGRPLAFNLLREGSVAAPPPKIETPPATEPEPVAIKPASAIKPDEHDPDRNKVSSMRAISQTVRVDIGKLDNLMNVVGELVISKNIMAQLVERLRGEAGYNELVMEFVKNSRVMERKLSELQSGVLEVRMVPVGQIFDKLHRNVRKLSRELDKEVEFRAEGGDTELDKLIIEELADPLMHIIRNCMDHGIESKAERIQAGKPGKGLILLRAFQRGNHVAIEINDDGAGINLKAIRKKAIEKGLLDPASDPRPEELTECLFVPGFSTAAEVSEISGRGVGLDVVKANISNLSGAVDVESNPGYGTTFTITLPITLAIIQALIVETGMETFAIPLNSVQQGLIIKHEDIQTIENREVIELRGKILPLLRLDKLFGLDKSHKTLFGPDKENGEKQKVGPESENEEMDPEPSDKEEAPAAGNGQEFTKGSDDEIYVVKVGIADRGMGIIVDKLFGRQDIVIKSVGDILKGIRGIAGATELGSQRTILVLDIMDLMDEAAVSTFRIEAGE